MKIYINALSNINNFIDYYNSGNVASNHLEKVVKWLLNAQQSDGGFSHSFSFINGWEKSYPETTGYIIETLFRLFKKNGDINIYNSAFAALRYLKSIQNNDGSFNDMNGNKQVFDVGQILIGFNYVFKNNFDKDIEINITNAANWLLKTQEKNGSFVAHSFNNIPHSYYSRVGSALIESGILLKNISFMEAGKKNINYVLDQQEENGFFRFSSFDNNLPYLHTIIYILEGLLKAFDLLKEERIFSSVLRCSSQLLKETKKYDILYSQYDSHFNSPNNHKCMTGLAQWAGVCFRIYHITKDENYRVVGSNTLEYISKNIISSSNIGLDGGIPGSLPIYGKYMKFSIPNWGQKFYIDSCLLKEKYCDI